MVTLAIRIAAAIQIKILGGVAVLLCGIGAGCVVGAWACVLYGWVALVQLGHASTPAHPHPYPSASFMSATGVPSEMEKDSDRGFP